MGTEHLDSVDPGEWAGLARWRAGYLFSVDKLSITKDAHIIGRNLAIEKPRIYPIGKSKARPNDIIELAITAGQISAHWDNVTWYAPRDWKAQVPDHILYGEQGRIFGLLTPKEQEILRAACAQYGASYAHNLYDAVGIGLRHLRRAGNGMVPVK